MAHKKVSLNYSRTLDYEQSVFVLEILCAIGKIKIRPKYHSSFASHSCIRVALGKERECPQSSLVEIFANYEVVKENMAKLVTTSTLQTIYLQADKQTDGRTPNRTT